MKRLVLTMMVVVIGMTIYTSYAFSAPFSASSVELETLLIIDRDIRLTMGEEKHGRFEADRGIRQMVNFNFGENWEKSLSVGYQITNVEEVWPLNPQNFYNKNLGTVLLGFGLEKNFGITKNLDLGLKAQYIQGSGMKEWEMSPRLIYHLEMLSPFVGVVYNDFRIEQGGKRWKAEEPFGFVFGAKTKNFQMEIKVFFESLGDRNPAYKERLERRNQGIDGWVTSLSYSF